MPDNAGELFSPDRGAFGSANSLHVCSMCIFYLLASCLISTMMNAVCDRKMLISGADADDDLDLESGSHYAEVHDERDAPSEGTIAFLVSEHTCTFSSKSQSITFGTLFLLGDILTCHSVPCSYLVWQEMWLTISQSRRAK